MSHYDRYKQAADAVEAANAALRSALEERPPSFQLVADLGAERARAQVERDTAYLEWLLEEHRAAQAHVEEKLETDFYRERAAERLGVRPEDVSEEERDWQKSVDFCKNYSSAWRAGMRS